MDQLDLVSASEQFFRDQGLKPVRDVLNDYETIIECELSDGTIRWLIDSRIPYFCSVTRSFYDTGFPEPVLRAALEQITRLGRCVKAWANDDTAVIVFESIFVSSPITGPAGIKVFHTVRDMLEGAWDEARKMLPSSSLNPGDAARQFIDRLESDLRRQFGG